jgi:integrase
MESIIAVQKISEQTFFFKEKIMTKNKTRKMTIRVIERLPGPPQDAKTSNIEYTVAQESNLYLAVYKNGARSWRFKMKFRKSHIFLTIGPYHLFSLEDAIEKVRSYKKMIANDIDPRIGEKSESNITFADFVEKEFLSYAKKNFKTFSNFQNMLQKRILKEFGSYRLSEITKRQIILFQKKVCEETSGTTSNRYISNLSSVFRLGCELDLLEVNPCKGIRKSTENKSRDRFLQHEEYVRFVQVLGGMLDNPQAQAIFLLLAMGTRRSELLGLAWEDVSLADRQAHLKDSKNGESRYLAINSVAADLLGKMFKNRNKNSPWVFPSRSASGHLQDVRKTFASICKQAGVSGLRLHDLRRSHASHLLSSGVDLVSVSKLLGHKSIKSTMTYARVATSSLAKSSEFAAVKIQEAMNQQ